jgi:polyisoprenoid-binding protein YceI
MAKGAEAGDPTVVAHDKLAPLAALLMWGVVIGGALAFDDAQGAAPETIGAPDNVASSVSDSPSAILSEAPEWTVTNGSLTFSVAQSGAPIEGVLGTWNAQISYDVATGTGTTQVNIDTTTLTLGSVTATAIGPEFFNTSAFTTSVFEADIERLDTGPVHQANGTLTLIGQTVPVILEFVLETDGATATMSGTTTLDRRDFGMGAGYADESTVGFAVDVTVNLTAQLSQ